jgi:hypothetical protein
MIKLKILYEQILKEVGDLENIQPYPYSGNSFITEQGWKVKVILTLWDEWYLEKFNINPNFYPLPIYNVGFTVEGVESQFNKTTLSEYLKILKTIALIVEKFNKKIKPNGLIFFATNKDESKVLITDPQKLKLYKLIVMKQLIKTNEYKTVNLEYEGFEGFMIYKKQI